MSFSFFKTKNRSIKYTVGTIFTLDGSTKTIKRDKARNNKQTCRIVLFQYFIYLFRLRIIFDLI
jgi:hypothetical protein